MNFLCKNLSPNIGIYSENIGNKYHNLKVKWKDKQGKRILIPMMNILFLNGASDTNGSDGPAYFIPTFSLITTGKDRQNV